MIHVAFVVCIEAEEYDINFLCLNLINNEYFLNLRLDFERLTEKV